jgi:hypothetical protein
MKSIRKSVTFLFAMIAIAMLFMSEQAQAQFNPYDDGRKIATIGVGFSSWGVPFYGRLEVPIADNITVGGGLSYRSRTSGFFNYSIIGLTALGNYHFNELLELPDEFDFYAGASLGYYIWNVTADDGRNYNGSEASGIGFDAQIGGRYFFKDNIALNLEFGGGNQTAGGSIGLSFLF